MHIWPVEWLYRLINVLNQWVFLLSFRTYLLVIYQSCNDGCLVGAGTNIGPYDHVCFVGYALAIQFVLDTICEWSTNYGNRNDKKADEKSRHICIDETQNVTVSGVPSMYVTRHLLIIMRDLAMKRDSRWSYCHLGQSATILQPKWKKITVINHRYQ